MTKKENKRGREKKREEKMEIVRSGRMGEGDREGEGNKKEGEGKGEEEREKIV